MKFAPILALAAALLTAPLALAGSPEIRIATGVVDAYSISQGPLRGHPYVGMMELFSAIRGPNPAPEAGSFDTYKTAADLEAILKQHPNQKFILFGSDTGRDMPAMAAATASHPDQIIAQYYHRVGGKIRHASDDQIPFYTSLDVAISEFNQGRMSEDDVTQVILAIESDDDLNADLVTDYAQCTTKPDWLDDLTDDASGKGMSSALLDRIQAIWTRAQHADYARTERYITGGWWPKDPGTRICTN